MEKTRHYKPKAERRSSRVVVPLNANEMKQLKAAAKRHESSGGNGCLASWARKILLRETVYKESAK